MPSPLDCAAVSCKSEKSILPARNCRKFPITSDMLRSTGVAVTSLKRADGFSFMHTFAKA